GTFKSGPKNHNYNMYYAVKNFQLNIVTNISQRELAIAMKFLGMVIGTCSKPKL
uniref:Uncharacterized protein n=1 Tax=Amphimedon queenslandica TaxID=400682 RepID=A0A1X7VRK3_AMPQE